MWSCSYFLWNYFVKMWPDWPSGQFFLFFHNWYIYNVIITVDHVKIRVKNVTKFFEKKYLKDKKWPNNQFLFSLSLFLQLSLYFLAGPSIATSTRNHQKSNFVYVFKKCLIKILIRNEEFHELLLNFKFFFS